MTRRNLFNCAFLLLACCQPAQGYSVLSHEAIIDAAWDTSIKPLLTRRYPAASADELIKAHSYAYGGAIIQDMGYYPFGSHFFSDLTHYVRSGDFVLSQLASAQDLNEYAFALGSMAHYASDNVGHQSVNRSVPLLYPKVRAKFGPVATYEDNPADHLRTEFSFDVAEVAQNHYAPEAYHDFIGFEVSRPLLERAFEETYGISLTEASKNLDLALGTYRHTVSGIIPLMTKVAWAANRKELMQAAPGLSRSRFIYALSRASYEKEWGRRYEHPGPWAHFLALLFRLIPKVGPFKALAFRVPTPETRRLFADGFVQTLSLYQQKLAELRDGKKPDLPNDNFDTGLPARFGTYRLADRAADKLLLELEARHFATVSEDLRRSTVAFYGTDTPRDRKAAAALVELRAIAAN